MDTETESQTMRLQTDRQSRHPTAARNFDEDGYLVDVELWDEELAQAIALQEGLGDLEENHWKVVHHLRERYLALGGMPSMRRVCRATGIPKVTIYDLFGSCLTIWRIAGLPNPGEEVKTYLI